MSRVRSKNAGGEGLHEPGIFPRSVVKSVLKLHGPPSPGSIQGRRIAVQAYDSDEGQMCHAYIASGTQIYETKVPMLQGQLQRGKSNLLMPTSLETSITTPLPGARHQSEIQTLAISKAEDSKGDNFLLGSISAHGRAVVQQLRTIHPGDESSEESVGASWEIRPVDAGAGEGGWAGLAFMPGHLNEVATARSMAKQVDIFDRDRHVRSLRTFQAPTALTFLEDPSQGHCPALIVTEGSQVSVWDVRVAERGGCVKRLLGSSGGEPLYCAASCGQGSSGLVAVGGAERSVVVFDSKKWSVRCRWIGCLKYEIMDISFSSLNSSFVYVNGLDFEVVCGRWDRDGARGADGRLFAFRGDSQWCGVTKAEGCDLVAGLCQSSNLFAAHMEKASDVVSGNDADTENKEEMGEMRIQQEDIEAD